MSSQNKYIDNKMFICAHCKEAFNRKSLLRAHVKVHLRNGFRAKDRLGSERCKKNKMHTCHVCDKEFLQLDRLKIHLLHHKGISYKCGDCKKSFASQESLDNYSCKCDDGIRKRKMGNDSGCNILNSIKLRSKSSRERKKGDCSERKRYKCDTCGKEFIKFVTLKIHILNIHQGINYQCDKCSERFPSEEDLIMHETKQDCKADDVWTCNKCGKTFAKKDYLKKHQYMHMNILFKCKYCYCAFMKEKSYKRHIEKMNCSKSARKIKMSEYNYKKCRICNSEYETEEVLIKHFKTTHVGLEPHQCFCCEACLPTFRDLQNHIHHHNIQKYTCNLCGKPYTSQEGFRKHRLKHKGAEFKCRYCSAEFLNESRFKFHEKNCKRNPETGCEFSEDREKGKGKGGRQKQSRQLHWESRIIVKHLRVDPKSENQKEGLAVHQQDNSLTTFFDESDTERTSERGWFDKYYKTDEDDIAFGVKKTNGKEPTDCDTDVSQTDSLKRKPSYPQGGEESLTNGEESSSDSISGLFSSSSEEESENENGSGFDYDRKKCRICLTVFGQEYELLHHFIKSHPNEYAHKCPECGAQSPLFAQLKEHMKFHGIGVGVYNCDNCSKQFRNEKKMKTHKIRCKGINAGSEAPEKMSQTSESRCRKCGKNFYTKFGYRRHKQFCKKESKNKNGECLNGKKAKNEEVFYLADSCEKTSENREKCDEGGKCNGPESTKEDKRVGEVNSVYLGEPPADSFPCRLCDKKFQYERGLVMHFKAAHPGNKPLVCHVCNMHLADKLKEHLKTHGIGEEFVCELCGKRFNQKFLSKIHEMWHQGIEYKCSNCKQKFLNKDKMDKHIQENRCSNRQSLMRLPCDICGKSYRSKFGLNKHYITHTPKELRPVKNRMNCEYCGKWFENNNGLQRHRRIHTGERPFCCRFCPKAFAQEGNCKAHEKIHTGESKPRRKKCSTQPPTVVAQLPPGSSVTQILPATPQIPGLTVEQIKYPVNFLIYSTVDLNAIAN